MNCSFRLNSIQMALCLVFPVVSMPVLAAEPYPSLPPTLSTSVTPNIVLFLDSSGSMLQDENNKWMQTGKCDSNVTGWDLCVNNNTNGYRTAVDSEADTPNSKMNIAKRVARNLVNNNRQLRFGVFSFQDKPNSIGGTERGQAALMRSKVREVSTDAGRDVVVNAINVVRGRTSTPLAEGLLEITRYYSGKSSLYGFGTYDSDAIQYRCQKNFTIIITDGDATDDQNLPGTGQKGADGNPVIAALNYTARNSSGAAVAKTFSVCKASSATADDGYNVTCPSTYDSDGSVRAFGDGSNRPSALRDVAMYAYRADLREGGNDGDAKSFDDPKFALQNMATYTIGFKVNNPVLPSAAKVGGGKYYSANNEAELTARLTDAVSSIVASISNAGGVAAQSETTTTGNKVLQPVFNPVGWYGELRCFNLDANGDLNGGCSPNPKGVIPAVADRKIFSSKVVSAATTKFDFNDSAGFTAMTANQQALLGSDATSQKKVINFLRGTEGISGFRTRPNGLLGDIVDGQPVVVSEPSGMTSDVDYGAFKATNKARNIALVGANDGMMHAFGIANMTELMGYIPSAVYPHLKALATADYGVSGGTPHTFHVNGTMRQQDVKLASAWKTIVVGGLAQGGQGFYAIDSTNDTALGTSSAVKWEWNDQNDADMGYSFAAPIIYNVRASPTKVVPAVILTNGYDNDYDDTAVFGQRKAEDSATCKRVVPGFPDKLCNTSALYVINANTGALIKKISLSGTADGVGGLSSPAGVDFGQDGILDYVYAGDMSGKVWRFDLTDNDPANFKVASTPIFDAGPTHPIVMRPAIKPVTRFDGVSLGNLVMFGTGKLLTDADRLDETTQTFYAVLDDMSASPTTVSRSELLERTIVGTESVSATGYRTGSYRKVSTDPAATPLDLTSASNTWKGWRLDFPVTTERLVTSPMLYDDKLLFGTGITKSTEKCLPGGKGWVMGLDPMTGSVTKSSRGKEFSFIDVKTDGKSTDADKVTFLTGAAFVSGFSKDGIPTELTYVASSSRIVTTASSDTTLGDIGQVIALKEANSMAVYTGNAGSGVSKGKSMDRPASTGSGKLYSGTIGDDTVGKESLLPPGAGVKVETSTWREIK